MSDISSSGSSKRCLCHIDDTIENLTQELHTLNEFGYKTELECSLTAIKMKREKLKALSAAVNSQALLAKIEVMIAESDLHRDIESLKNYKRRKLDRNEKSQLETPSAPRVTPPLTTNTVSVQTTESMYKKKKKTRLSPFRKSPVDISSDETMIVPTIHKSSALLGEASQVSQTSFSLGLFTKTSTKSDSEVSLSSSIKAEFNQPYTKTHTQEPVTKFPTKEQKSTKSVESKSNSKHVSKHTHSTTGTPKTVADLRKSVKPAVNHTDSSSHTVSSPKNNSTGDKKPTACATSAPIRHNLGILLTQPSTSTISPYPFVNPATRANTQHNSQTAGKSHAFSFYGSKP